MGYSWSIRGVFIEYSWGIRMYRVCVGYVSGMYRECVEAYCDFGVNNGWGERGMRGQESGRREQGKSGVEVEEKMRKRNFVVFTCVCEKIFVPLHAFRACMRTITISQVRAPIRNKAKICNAKHYKHDRLHQRRTDILNPYLRGD